MILPLPSYRDVLTRARRIQWDLDDAIDDLDLDLECAFLPGRLCDLSDIPFLEGDRERVANQIAGCGYAHLLDIAEAFIVPLVTDLAHSHEEDAARDAMLAFGEEEVKHQLLFRAFQDAFRTSSEIEVALIEDSHGIAAAVLERPPLSVLLLTSMLEWVTQRHHLEVFRHDGIHLDGSFCQILELHWLEESQHAKLDSLEIVRAAQKMEMHERQQALDAFVELCALLDDVIHKQAALLVTTITEHTGLPVDQHAPLELALWRSFRWGFLSCGLDHPVFMRIVDALTRIEGPLEDSDVSTHLQDLAERYAA